MGRNSGCDSCPPDCAVRKSSRLEPERVWCRRRIRPRIWRNWLSWPGTIAISPRRFAARHWNVACVSLADVSQSARRRHDTRGRDLIDLRKKLSLLQKIRHPDNCHVKPEGVSPPWDCVRGWGTPLRNFDYLMLSNASLRCFLQNFISENLSVWENTNVIFEIFPKIKSFIDVFLEIQDFKGYKKKNTGIVWRIKSLQIPYESFEHKPARKNRQGKNMRNQWKRFEEIGDEIGQNYQDDALKCDHNEKHKHYDKIRKSKIKKSIIRHHE